VLLRLCCGCLRRRCDAVLLRLCCRCLRRPVRVPWL
jgi:hypothetical protein